MEKDRFKQHLINQTGLSPSSVNVYSRIVNKLIEEFGHDPMLIDINKFLLEKRRNRQCHAKYAVRHYLLFEGRLKEARRIAKITIKRPARERFFLTKSKILQIIEDMKPAIYQDIARLQAATGARASEIISIDIKKHRTEAREGQTIHRLQIRRKGEKPGYIYLNGALWGVLEKYKKACRNYPFIEHSKEGLLKGEAVAYLDFWNRVEGRYKGYWQSLKKAGRAHDIDLGTHDLRRSFAQHVREGTGDIFKVKQALGHSSITTTIRYFEENEQEVSTTMLEQQNNI